MLQVELLALRGFQSETHYVPTSDGYYLHLVRVINPLASEVLKRPVIFNHGLLECSTIWLINSRNFKPLKPKKPCGNLHSNNAFGNMTSNGPLLLANEGYDVWLMSMRGTDWSLGHESLSPDDSEFWNYSLDDFALVDVPSVVDYVMELTGASKVAYIGHSQATFSIFGLLSTRPSYADVIEPVIAVAPVAFFEHITSAARLVFLGTLTATNKDTHGPFPPEAGKIRGLTSEVCGSSKMNMPRLICQLIEILVSGAGEKWLKGYYNHLPFYSSLKILRHFGQLIKYKKYGMYDYGKEENLKIYGTPTSPSYPVERIRSRSLCLIRTKSDALSTPKDVDRFKSRLTVPLHKDIFIDGDYNHFDLITDRKSGRLVFEPILEILDSFERKTGVCAQGASDAYLLNDLTAPSGGQFIAEYVD